MVRYWLMKSEPHVYPFSQLVEDGSTHWDGVRNYQARNMMRDDLKLGDMVLFYHSNTKPPHVAGIARVSREGYPDHTSWDPDSKYYDEKSSPENPRWIMVDIEAVQEIEKVSLVEIKANPALEGMPLVQKGQRLSVQPVSKEQYEEICRMGGIE
ncbi:MAG: EVE domain-containing protein [Euryarchaeota archaeon]|nr:EVE domain-containing protein [Euryarchaeota archaeon]|tara:strand:+ start:17248 stop:17709 length:462 start_codon:yes stop_codon:yes gene_type:complete